jgi:nitrous oxide reductase accessory protein NosL
LYLQEGRDDIVKREVADFNSGTFLDAEKAYYVEGSSVHLCCSEGDVQKDRAGVQYERTWDRCLPSLVAFKTQEEAERFMQKNGGALKLYLELTLENAEAR